MRKTILYSLAFVALGIGSGLLGPTLPALAAQTNAEMKQISNLFIARSFGTMIGSWMIGRFYDRIAGHPLLASSLLAVAVAMALTPSAPRLPALLALTAFMGIALASINVGGNALIVLVHGERVRPFISLLHFAFGLGGYLAPTLVAQLERRADGLQLTYWLLALATVPVALITFLSPSPSLRKHRSLDSMAGAPALMIALFAVFAFMQIGAEATAMGWYFSYAVERGMDRQAAAYLNSGFWAAFTVGRLATIWMSVRFNAASLIVTSLSIALLFALGLLVFTPAPFVLWFGAIGLGLAIAPAFPNAFGLAERMLGLSGKITGFLLVGSSVGSMFWPWLTGQFFKSQGPQVMAMVVALNLFGALAIIALLILRPARA
ncbi:MAG TPA: MFS transporter [Blastocatellia bacterium]|jgi:FHS family Na+ dependent glucose MFS transporter 1|nr:MFS transporter [Blastocatellia bacterium]